jgi:excisionase family DNA binding protein
MGDHYTISQVAEKLHKSEQSVRVWLQDGKLPYILVSERRRLIAKSDLQDFVNLRKICPPPKRIDKVGLKIGCSGNRSLKTSGERAKVNVRIPNINWREELSHVSN